MRIHHLDCGAGRLRTLPVHQAAAVKMICAHDVVEFQACAAGRAF